MNLHKLKDRIRNQKKYASFCNFYERVRFQSLNPIKLMKTKTLLLAIAALSIPALAQAEDGKKCEKGKKGCDQRRERIIEKFDADGDGKLSEEERATAKAAMAARKAEFMARVDTDGDGEISEDEKKAAKEAFMAQYDTDGDGKLNEEERKAAKEAGAGHFGHGHHKKGAHKKGKRAQGGAE